MRKESGFEVMDRIRVAFSGNETVLKIAERNAAEICDETLADSVSEGTLTHSKEWNINGEAVTVSVEKI
jgi:isoleucyl-tRNA synthetase